MKGGHAFAAGDDERIKQNVEQYRLHLADGLWERMTDNSAWRQFALKYAEDMKSLPEIGWYTGEVLKQLGYPYELHEDHDDDEYDDRWHVIHVNDVPVQCGDRYGEIRITIQGSLPESDIGELLARLKEAAQNTNRVVTDIKEL